MTRFSDTLLARLLRRLAQAVCQHPKWFVYPQILLFLLGVFYAAHGLTLDMSRNHLVGEKSRYHQIYLRFRKEFPAPDELVLVAESGSSERNRQFVERLAARLATETNLFTDLFYKADLTTLGPKALLLVPEKNLEEMRQTLHDNRPFLQQLTQATNLNSLFELINRQFLTADGRQNAGTDFVIRAIPALQRIVAQATHSLVAPGTPPSPGVASLLGVGDEAGEQSYVTFDHGRIYLVTVRAKSEALIAAAIERLRQLMQQTQSEVPGLNAGLTGGPVLDYDEMRQSQHDSIVASIVSLVLCSLIFIFAYRQLSAPLKAAICLIIGLGYTIGFVTLAIGHLNILTITFTPMLIGLAIDFGIHFISRYEEERRHGRPGTEAVEKTMTFTGQGIVTGAFTTAMAFLAMGLTHFKAIREMGIISGGGLMLCLIPMLTLLPVLLLRGRQDAINQPTSAFAARRVRIENLWLQRPVLVVGLTLVLCAGAALQFHKVRFDYDLLHLQSKGLPAVVYEQRLIRSASQSVIYGSVIADDLRQAQEYTAKLKQLPAVASVQSVADYVTEDQTKKLQLVRAIKSEVQDLQFAPMDQRPVDIHELDPTLWYLTGFLGLAAEAAQPHDPNLARQLRSLRESILQLRKAMFSGQPQIPERLAKFQQALFTDLHQTFDALKNQDASGPLRPQDLPPTLRHRFIGVTGKYLLQVYPKRDIWQHDNQREFIRELQSVIPENNVNGTPFELYQYTTLLKNSYQQAAWYALGAIIIMIFLHFRSLDSVILAFLPVAVGTVWLLGFMGALGIPFNPANIMTLPLVIGIGVTNGIQILNRLAEEHQPGVFAKSTGKAVLVSGLTAIAGFGSLILAKHQGIKSLGIVMSVGIAGCMIAALTFLPALLNLLMRRGWTIKLGSRDPR
jgi:hopanoid biosynthesis associated RND transporter like protein HpnN